MSFHCLIDSLVFVGRREPDVAVHDPATSLPPDGMSLPERSSSPVALPASVRDALPQIAAAYALTPFRILLDVIPAEEPDRDHEYTSALASGGVPFEMAGAPPVTTTRPPARTAA